MFVVFVRSSTWLLRYQNISHDLNPVLRFLACWCTNDELSQVYVGLFLNNVVVHRAEGLEATTAAHDLAEATAFHRRFDNKMRNKNGRLTP